jgi:D-alanine-D-alanine ligase
MATHQLLHKNDDWNLSELMEKIGFPCFVKANKAGSSYGVTKVHKASEMETAIKAAFLEDDQVLIERFLDGTEVSIGVIEYKGEIIVLPPTEIIANGDFFDYQAKYEGNSQEITPARITDEQLHNLNIAAKKVFTILGAKGFSRSDFIFQGNMPYFLELNSVPGLTEESLLPQQARHAGISLSDLFTDMLYNCLKNNTFDA